MEDEFLKMLKGQNCDVLEVSEFKTPATEYPEKKVGKAEIERKNYRKGIYFMDGVKGYDFFFVKKPIPVTSLKISGKQWMVDDPLHYEGMKLLAINSKGNVLVGGLGLGLVIHELAKNPDVKRIDVAEINPDVIELIKPLIPDKKVRIMNKNVFSEDFLKEDYDTVILDLWMKAKEEESKKIGLEMLGAYSFFKHNFPKANVFIWGIREKAINPAVFKEKLCKAYDLLREAIG